MDERRAHLVAAAEAARTWVRAQRATWQGGLQVSFTPLHAPALSPSVSDGGAPEASRMASAQEPAAHSPSGTPFAISAPLSIDFTARAEGGLRSLRALASVGAPPLQRFWRVGLAASVVLACTGMARAYWPAWTTALRAQLKAAGEHAAVFERLTPAGADRPAVVKGRSPAARADAAPRRTGHLQADSEPAGAHVVVDGKDRGVTPLLVRDLALGGHTVVLHGEPGELRRTVSIAADKTTQLKEAIYSGWLHVSSPVELQISEGSRNIRLDDSNQALLPPGPHEVRFENRTFGFVEVLKLDINPGATSSVSIVPPASKLSITASTPAEVLLDGTLIGGTPLTDYALAVGTRELTIRNSAGVERRMTLTVTVEPVRLEIDFSKP